MRDTDTILAEGSRAEIFEHFLVSGIFSAWAPELLTFASFQPGERLLDVACGTGIVARSAASVGAADDQLTGLDINQEMLELARSLCPAISWIHGDAMQIELSDAQFEVVTCQQGLQFFPDRGTALREMHRVLVPGGRLAAAVWCSEDQNPALGAVRQSIENHLGPEASEVMRIPCSLGDAEEIFNLLRSAGFEGLAIRRMVIPARFPSPRVYAQVLVTGGALARAGIVVAEEALSAITVEVEDALISYVGNGGLEIPMAGYLAIGHKTLT